MIGPDPLDLAGQVAFVTGAGQGAGRAIALMLARHNAGGIAVNDFVQERAASDGMSMMCPADEDELAARDQRIAAGDMGF